ncbi:MAG: Fe-S cluster assembly ATPase SufC [Acidimicrobiales bacterium]
MAQSLEIKDLHVAVETTEILHGVNLVLAPGEVHALMGPNGSGKSTLVGAIAGNPFHRVTSGQILLCGEDITYYAADIRAKAGLFLAFQYPEEVSGVPVIQFLRQAMAARRGVELSVIEVRIAMMEWMERLGMDPSFAERYLNEGFSGGEKKRNEVLQMALLDPRVAMLDETDSGLDVDAMKVVARGVEALRATNKDLSILIVTHYQRVLDILEPDRVHVLVNGRVVDEGDATLARTLEKKGYEQWRT